jgi:hypothetical protein
MIKVMTASISLEQPRGQFLWLPDEARRQYVEKLKKRIQDNFYSADDIVSAVCEKLAPAFDDEIEKIV